MVNNGNHLKELAKRIQSFSEDTSPKGEATEILRDIEYFWVHSEELSLTDFHAVASLDTDFNPLIKSAIFEADKPRLSLWLGNSTNHTCRKTGEVLARPKIVAIFESDSKDGGRVGGVLRRRPVPIGDARAIILLLECTI